MALRLEKDPDPYRNLVPFERVVPDLALKLPNLFGPDVDTTFKQHLIVPGLDFYVGSSHYPKDYVHLNAYTGKRMSLIYVLLRDLFGNEDRWSAEVSSTIDGNTGLLFEWTGSQTGRAQDLAIRWPHTLPNFNFDTQKGIVTASNADRGMEPLELDELVRKTERASKWMEWLQKRTTVRLNDLTIDPEANLLTADLVWQFRGFPVFPIRVPFMAEVNRVNGITSK